MDLYLLLEPFDEVNGEYHLKPGLRVYTSYMSAAREADRWGLKVVQIKTTECLSLEEYEELYRGTSD